MESHDQYFLPAPGEVTIMLQAVVFITRLRVGRSPIGNVNFDGREDVGEMFERLLGQDPPK